MKKRVAFRAARAHPAELCRKAIRLSLPLNTRWISTRQKRTRYWNKTRLWPLTVSRHVVLGTWITTLITLVMMMMPRTNGLLSANPVPYSRHSRGGHSEFLPTLRAQGSPRSGPSRTYTLFHSNYPPMSRHHQCSRCPPKQQRRCRFTPNRTHPSSVLIPGVDMGPIPGITLTNDAGSATVWTSRVEAPNRPDGTQVDALPCQASSSQKRHEHPTEEEAIGKKLKNAQDDEDEGRREHGMGYD
ncbi:hypothetical protein CSHISOI_03518 [Colletotrichum shisoi]|uniref:Uncharacterized protein n=1 Tax=Colletotrichum shisoi TaxID=2078593 RepID=A0A5Q4BY56_9PEZI|nr:hypothetical protein CSHISOI_03518 [Colletotrichum shisoi]